MHINTVMVNGFWVDYGLESVRGEITIVANFIKNGKTVEKIYKINSLSKQGAHMVAALLDDEFAVAHARQIMAEHGKSKHSVFYEDED